MPDKDADDTAEKAHELSRKIANQRPLKKRDKDAPEDNVSGGFNQKSHASEDNVPIQDRSKGQ